MNHPDAPVAAVAGATADSGADCCPADELAGDDADAHRPVPGSSLKEPVRR